MKKILVASFILTLMSQVSAASLKCPAGSQQLLKCVDAQQGTDQILAINFMDSAVVCQDSEGHIGLIVGLKNTAPSELIPVKEIVRMGATSYQARFGNVDFALIRMISPTRVNGTFAIDIAGQRASRSLSCK